MLNSLRIASQHLVELETFFIEHGMYEQAKWESTNVEVTNRMSKQTMEQSNVHQFFR